MGARAHSRHRGPYESRNDARQIAASQRGMAPPLKQAEGGTWLARLRSAPIEGKANAELIALVAEHYQCPKSAVSIKSGAAGRIKLVRIDARWARGLDRR